MTETMHRASTQRRCHPTSTHPTTHAHTGQEEEEPMLTGEVDEAAAAVLKKVMASRAVDDLESPLIIDGLRHLCGTEVRGRPQPPPPPRARAASNAPSLRTPPSQCFLVSLPFTYTHTTPQVSAPTCGTG